MERAEGEYQVKKKAGRVPERAPLCRDDSVRSGIEIIPQPARTARVAQAAERFAFNLANTFPR